MASKIVVLAAAMGAALLVTGCQTTEKGPVVLGSAQFAVPEAQPVVLSDYNWKVYDLDGLKALIAEIEKSGNKNIRIYAVTENGYKAINLNLLELKRYIEEQKQIIQFVVQTNGGQTQNVPGQAQVQKKK